tara:strand:- start:455 stop:598 length:144 start_codon:yes stop_codon:yes gene_type:complete
MIGNKQFIKSFTEKEIKKKKPTLKSLFIYAKKKKVKKNKDKKNKNKK